MSQNFEESALEEALRGDLPTAETERRLRRRLLAAGVAVGNGVATTAAAAGQAAGTAATATGVVGKVLGASWGIKLGAAAAVAIPTLGLWLEHDEPAATSATTSAPMVRPQDRATSVTPLQAIAAAPAEAETKTSPEATPDPTPERVVSRGSHPAPPEPPAVVPLATPSPHPSQSSFEALEPAKRAPQVGSTLAEETRLLDAAFVAIGAGQRERAAQLIGEHEARYPSGLLKQERERAKLKLSELSRGE